MSLTLKGFIRAIAPILVRMCQQTLLAVCLLHLAISRRALNGQYLIEIGGAAFPNPQHGRFLLGCVFAILIALVMLSRPGTTTVLGIGSRRRGWHVFGRKMFQGLFVSRLVVGRARGGGRYG